MVPVGELVNITQATSYVKNVARESLPNYSIDN